MISSFELLFKLQPLPNKYTYNQIPSLNSRPDMVAHQPKPQENYEKLQVRSLQLYHI